MKYLKPWLSAAALSLAAFAGAQIIDNRNGRAFENEMYFNQEFIWQNKVRTIATSTAIKRPSRPIEARPDVVVYRFNEVGLLIQLDRVRSVLQFVDSTSILFRHNGLGDVEQRSERGTRGISTKEFKYDASGRIIRVDYGSAENIASDAGKLEPGKTIAVNSETFVWNEAAEGTAYRKEFNNYGLHYATTSVTSGTGGYLQKEETELILSGRITTNLYTYNERGWVSSVESTDNQATQKSSRLFEYDELGNLLKVKYLKNEEVVREVEILYTDNLLIEALLDMDMSTNDIVIQKFTYEFVQP